MSVERMAYTGTLSCGCIVNAVVITDATRGEQAEIGDWVREGMTVDRRPVNEVKADPNFMPANHKDHR